MYVYLDDVLAIFGHHLNSGRRVGEDDDANGLDGDHAGLVLAAADLTIFTHSKHQGIR